MSSKAPFPHDSENTHRAVQHVLFVSYIQHHSLEVVFREPCVFLGIKLGSSNGKVSALTNGYVSSLQMKVCDLASGIQSREALTLQSCRCCVVVERHTGHHVILRQLCQHVPNKDGFSHPSISNQHERLSFLEQ